jgi:hypothetical protein
MKSRTSARSRAARTAATITEAVRPELTWIHDGLRCRVAVWPEVRFERETAPAIWEQVEPSENALASAALGVTAPQWRRYLEFVPALERSVLEKFAFSRMSALLVIVRCPALTSALSEVPALIPFLAHHASLRGGDEPSWAEISAVFEREGLFGVLQWLGLPASRQTIGILAHIADPDLPRRLLEPLRTALWEPQAIWQLSHAAVLSDEQLTRACHALAA